MNALFYLWLAGALVAMFISMAGLIIGHVRGLIRFADGTDGLYLLKTSVRFVQDAVCWPIILPISAIEMARKFRGHTIRSFVEAVHSSRTTVGPHVLLPQPIDERTQEAMEKLADALRQDLDAAFGVPSNLRSWVLTVLAWKAINDWVDENSDGHEDFSESESLLPKRREAMQVVVDMAIRTNPPEADNEVTQGGSA